MTNWQSYWRRRGHISKTLCSTFTILDSFRLFKDPLFIGDLLESNKWLLEMSIEENGLKVKMIDFAYTILVEKQSCQFGGHRYFVHCCNPKCKRRMRKLYCYRGFFLCRKCLNLGYYSQRVVPSTRLWLMQKRVEKSLEKAGGNVWKKPKWMHRSTFEHLQIRYRDYQMKSDQAYLEEMEKMYGIYI